MKLDDEGVFVEVAEGFVRCLKERTRIVSHVGEFLLFVGVSGSAVQVKGDAFGPLEKKATKRPCAFVVSGMRRLNRQNAPRGPPSELSEKVNASAPTPKALLSEHDATPPPLIFYPLELKAEG